MFRDIFKGLVLFEGDDDKGGFDSDTIRKARGEDGIVMQAQILANEMAGSATPSDEDIKKLIALRSAFPEGVDVPDIVNKVISENDGVENEEESLAAAALTEVDPALHPATGERDLPGVADKDKDEVDRVLGGNDSGDDKAEKDVDKSGSDQEKQADILVEYVHDGKWAQVKMIMDKRTDGLVTPALGEAIMAALLDENLDEKGIEAIREIMNSDAWKEQLKGDSVLHDQVNNVVNEAIIIAYNTEGEAKDKVLANLKKALPEELKRGLGLDETAGTEHHQVGAPEQAAGEEQSVPASSGADRALPPASSNAGEEQYGQLRLNDGTGDQPDNAVMGTEYGKVAQGAPPAVPGAPGRPRANTAPAVSASPPGGGNTGAGHPRAATDGAVPPRAATDGAVPPFGGVGGGFAPSHNVAAEAAFAMSVSPEIPDDPQTQQSEPDIGIAADIPSIPADLPNVSAAGDSEEKPEVKTEEKTVEKKTEPESKPKSEPELIMPNTAKTPEKAPEKARGVDLMDQLGVYGSLMVIAAFVAPPVAIAMAMAATIVGVGMVIEKAMPAIKPLIAVPLTIVTAVTESLLNIVKGIDNLRILAYNKISSDPDLDYHQLGYKGTAGMFKAFYPQPAAVEQPQQKPQPQTVTPPKPEKVEEVGKGKSEEKSGEKAKESNKGERQEKSQEASSNSPSTTSEPAVQPGYGAVGEMVPARSYGQDAGQGQQQHMMSQPQPGYASARSAQKPPYTTGGYSSADGVAEPATYMGGADGAYPSHQTGGHGYPSANGATEKLYTQGASYANRPNDGVILDGGEQEYGSMPTPVVDRSNYGLKGHQAPQGGQVNVDPNIGADDGYGNVFAGHNADAAKPGYSDERQQYGGVNAAAPSGQYVVPEDEPEYGVLNLAPTDGAESRDASHAEPAHDLGPYAAASKAMDQELIDSGMQDGDRSVSYQGAAEGIGAPASTPSVAGEEGGGQDRPRF